MIYPKRRKRSHNDNMLFSQGALNFLGGLPTATLWTLSRSPVLEWAHVISMISGIGVIIFVVTRRKVLSNLSASLIFAVNLIPAYWLVWTSNAAHSTQGRFWIPFQAHQLACLTVAILAPPNRKIGALTILLFPALAILQYETFSPEQLAWLPARAVVAPILFGGFALILYFFSLRGIGIAELAAKTEAEVQMMEKVTHAILAIKDLANSPIQALSLDAETLRRKHSEDAPVAARIEKSVNQLRELNRILDEHLRGSASASIEASFDPHEKLLR